MAISTRDLSGMPDVDVLRRYLQSVAMLEAILMSGLNCGSAYPSPPDHRFDMNWRPGEELAHWDNGQGDNFFAVFSRDGCWLKGFAHEAPMFPYRTTPPQLWKDIFKGMPECFHHNVKEPAFQCEDNTTLCIWRRSKAFKWARGEFTLPRGKAPDLSFWILSRFERTPDQWAEWENENFERGKNPIDRGLVQVLFDHKPLTHQMVRMLEPRAQAERCREAAQEIGYPWAVTD